MPDEPHWRLQGSTAGSDWRPVRRRSLTHGGRPARFAASRRAQAQREQMTAFAVSHSYPEAASHLCRWRRSEWPSVLERARASQHRSLNDEQPHGQRTSMATALLLFHRRAWTLPAMRATASMSIGRKRGKLPRLTVYFDTASRRQRSPACPTCGEPYRPGMQVRRAGNSHVSKDCVVRPTSKCASTSPCRRHPSRRDLCLGASHRQWPRIECRKKVRRNAVGTTERGRTGRPKRHSRGARRATADQCRKRRMAIPIPPRQKPCVGRNSSCARWLLFSLPGNKGVSCLRSVGTAA